MRNKPIFKVIEVKSAEDIPEYIEFGRLDSWRVNVSIRATSQTKWTHLIGNNPFNYMPLRESLDGKFWFNYSYLSGHPWNEFSAGGMGYSNYAPSFIRLYIKNALPPEFVGTITARLDSLQ